MTTSTTKNRNEKLNKAEAKSLVRDLSIVAEALAKTIAELERGGFDRRVQRAMLDEAEIYAADAKNLLDELSRRMIGTVLL